MFHTSLCDLLDIDTPILQAGMGANLGSPTTPALVAAVSNAGGLGCLDATGFTPVAAQAEVVIRARVPVLAEASQIISNLQSSVS